MAVSKLTLINRQVLAWMQRTREHKENKRIRGLPPVITISRQMGSGGREISKAVCEKLGEPWKVWNKEIIDEIAKRARIRKELVELADEKITSGVKEYIADLFGEEFLSFPTYHRFLVECLAGIGQVGFAVVLGRGGNFILREALNVRLICPMDARIAYEMEVEKVSRKTAVSWIAKSDSERARFVRDLFGKDINDSNYYDLVINTGQISHETASDLIVSAARKKWDLKGI